MPDPDPTVDLDALRGYLDGVLDEDVVDASRIDEGLNLLVSVATAEDPTAYVVRRPSKARYGDLFGDLRSEYALLERLADTPVPSPRAVHYCDDPGVIDDEFLVMTFLDGETVAWDDPLPERFRHSDARQRYGRALVDAASAIHSLEAERFADVCQRRSPAAQVERALDRLDDATRVTGHEVPTLRELGDWLLANAPDDRPTALAHGDLQPYNVLVAGDDVPAITGVLDWEAAYLGDPRVELGYLLLSWREADDPVLDCSAIADRHGDRESMAHVRERNRNGLFPWTTEAGTPSRRDLVERWEAETGVPFERDRYFRAHAAFLLGTVWEDIYRDRMETDGYGWEPHVEWAALLGRRIAEGDVPL